MVLPEGVGGYSKRLDKALPGKHTRTLYDALKRRESDILVQLRTGMARVNRYLHRIAQRRQTYVTAARKKKRLTISSSDVHGGTSNENTCEMSTGK
jgi:hypothetical protein